jgi:putative membrane protein insertion efficiency factor
MNTPCPVRFAFVGAVRLPAVRAVRFLVRFVVRRVAPFVVRAAALPILVYRYGISPLIGPRCRFHPSCSEYALGALDRFGLLRGLWLIGTRLMRCHPWHPGGINPLPDSFESRGTYIGRAIRSNTQPGVLDTTCPCDPARPVRDARAPSLHRS